MDIRFDNEPKKGQTPTTRLHMPNKETAEDFESRSERNPSRGRSASRAAEEPHVRVEKPELNPLARIGLILCGFIFAGMVLFTLTGYERISRAYADINALNTEIDSTKLRINELEVQIECAVTIQDAQKVAEAYGMQYPEKSQYVKIGDPLPFSGSDYPVETTTEPTESPAASTPDPGTGDTGDTTGGGSQPPSGG